MNIWENTVLTEQGRALQAKLLKGQTLKIKRVATGAKKVPVVDLRQQTNVTEGGYDIILQPARTDGDNTVIPALLENKGLNESYELWQVGFYAEDPDEGEILFCLSQASQSKHIPSEKESPGFSITWDFYFNTSDTAPFEVVLDSVGLVNIEAYQVHTDQINKLNERVDSVNSDFTGVSTNLQEVSKELSKKANKTDLDTINRNLSGKADRTALTDLVRITTATRSITGLGAGLAVATTVDYNTPSGYKLIGSYVQDTGNAGLMVYTATPTNLRVKNIGSTRIDSCTVTLGLIFIKNI